MTVFGAVGTGVATPPIVNVNGVEPVSVMPPLFRTLFSLHLDDHTPC